MGGREQHILNQDVPNQDLLKLLNNTFNALHMAVNEYTDIIIRTLKGVSFLKTKLLSLIK